VAKVKGTAAGERVIKRYENRKLYDPQARRHVTLEGLAGLVARGEDVRVVDQKTGEDLTTVTLAQVVLEGVKQGSVSIPGQVLARLIRLAAAPTAAWADWKGPQEVAQRARQDAERIASGLVNRGRLTLDEALALRQEIAGSVQRLVTEAQSGLEGRVRGLLERGEGTPGVSPTLRALKGKLTSFEALLEPPRRPRKGAGRRKKTGPGK
jgi:polyhydroxyalkanoate synthesis repressor PhaR